MRFELWLSELPDFTVGEAKTKLAGFPKGLTAGVIVKALQDRRLPSVAVAFSEDLGVINEIDDRLTAFGAECYVIDHAFFVRRIITRLGQRFRRSRYRHVEEDRSLVKVGSADRAAFHSDVVRTGLLWLLQWALVEGLFVWRLTLDVGAGKLFRAGWFVPQLVLCAVGLLGATVLAESGWAFRRGTLSLPKTLAAGLPSLVCTALAVVFFNAGREDETQAGRSLGRPPSKPFAGLLAELRKRDVAGERPVELSVDAADWDALGDSAGDLMCLDRTNWDRGLRECLAGPSWELALACLPLPSPVSPPPPKVSRRVAAEAKPIGAPLVRAKVLQPWRFAVALWDVSLVMFAWLASLFGAVWFARRPSKTSVGTPPEGDAYDPDVTRPTSVNPQEQALRAELSEVQAQAWGYQNTIATYEQQLGPFKLAYEANLAEIAQLRESLQGVRRPQGGVSVPANTQDRAVGVPVQSATASGSSYSVSSGQEERIGPKRTR